MKMNVVCSPKVAFELIKARIYLGRKIIFLAQNATKNKHWKPWINVSQAVVARLIKKKIIVILRHYQLNVIISKSAFNLRQNALNLKADIYTRVTNKIIAGLERVCSLLLTGYLPGRTKPLSLYSLRGFAVTGC